MMLYVCTMFRKNILDSIKGIERTRFAKGKISKRHNFTKNVGGVAVLVLCTLSGDALYLYQVS